MATDHHAVFNTQVAHDYKADKNTVFFSNAKPEAYLIDVKFTFRYGPIIKIRV